MQLIMSIYRYLYAPPLFKVNLFWQALYGSTIPFIFVYLCASILNLPDNKGFDYRTIALLFLNISVVLAP